MLIYRIEYQGEGGDGGPHRRALEAAMNALRAHGYAPGWTVMESTPAAVIEAPIKDAEYLEVPLEMDGTARVVVSPEQDEAFAVFHEPDTAKPEQHWSERL